MQSPYVPQSVEAIRRKDGDELNDADICLKGFIISSAHGSFEMIWRLVLSCFNPSQPKEPRRFGLLAITPSLSIEIDGADDCLVL